MLSYSSGMETYDSIYFVVMFFMALSPIAAYFLIRILNKQVALLSLPLSILIFTQPALVGVLNGHWPSLLAQSFLIVFAWSAARIELRNSWLFMSIIFSAIFLTHASEAVFGGVFTVFFFTPLLLARHDKNILKSLLVFAALTFAVCAYYIEIFLNTWRITQPYVFGIEPLWDGGLGIYLGSFGLLLVIIGIGFFLSLTKLKEIHPSFIFGYSMLLAGFMNYAGFGFRSFQLRLFWPIYFAVFFGFGAYLAIRFFYKNSSFYHFFGLFAVLTIIIAGVIPIPGILHYTPFHDNGIMNPYHWNALKWISEKTEKNASIYFFYGVIYSQDALLRNSKRIHTQVDTEGMQKSLDKKTIERYYVSEIPGDNGGGIRQRLGFFNYIDLEKIQPSGHFFGPMDICSFDYLVIDKLPQQVPLINYNLLIASELLKNDFVSKVFENEVVMVLKNGKPKSSCIRETTF